MKKSQIDRINEMESILDESFRMIELRTDILKNRM